MDILCLQKCGWCAREPCGALQTPCWTVAFHLLTTQVSAHIDARSSLLCIKSEISSVKATLQTLEARKAL